MNVRIEAGFRKLYDIVNTLRSENGCAWDRKQTVRSLLPNLIEEAYELIEAVEDQDHNHIREELGDLFLLVTMIGYISEETEQFRFNDVFDDISEKLVRRHPHVFGDGDEKDPDAIIKQWNDIKRDVEGRDQKKYITDSIPRTMPPLERAFKIQKKVSQYGFDWNNIREVIAKIHEEIDELQDEIASAEITEKIEDEIGDVLFAAVNIARYLKIDPSLALHKTNTKFINRFNFVQDKMREKGIALSEKEMKKMDSLWNESKEFFP